MAGIGSGVQFQQAFQPLFGVARLTKGGFGGFEFRGQIGGHDGLGNPMRSSYVRAKTSFRA